MGIEILWKLIEDETEAISAYYLFLESPFAQTVEAAPIVETVRAIIADERDHLNALKYLCDALTREKPATDMTEAAHAALSDYRERGKLIK